MLSTAKYLPCFVAIQKGGKDAVEVCAGADEEEDNHEEGLELQDAELGNALSLWFVSTWWD